MQDLGPFSFPLFTELPRAKILGNCWASAYGLSGNPVDIKRAGVTNSPGPSFYRVFYAILAPIVDDIDAGNVVTRIVRSLHRDALDVGAESLLAHGTIRLVAAHIRPRNE